jgi:hypothetical protein
VALKLGSDPDAADDVRESIGAPLELTYKPYNVFTNVGPYYWTEGIRDALLSDNWLKSKDEPYRYLWRAARGILWDLMRKEDSRNRAAAIATSLPDELIDPEPILSTSRMEMLRDFKRALDPVKRLTQELYQFLEVLRSAADDETGEPDWSIVERRFRGENPHSLKHRVERRYGCELDRLYRGLGGYVLRRDRFQPRRRKLDF